MPAQKATEPEPRTLPAEIRTERLVLRAAGPEDAAEQSAVVTASLAELKPWLPWAQAPQSVEDATENLAEAARKFEDGEEFNWLIRDGQSGALVGRVSVFAVNWRVPKGEIGYWLSSTCTGAGYMREAVRGVVRAAEAEGFRRLEIRCDARNAPSARVAEAVGFTLDARFVNDQVAPDDSSKLRDTLIYSLVR